MKKVLILMLLLCMVCFGACSCNKKKEKEYVISDQNLTSAQIEDNYRTYYEIFVGSFSDSNKDGVGDINGIIQRLDYLNDGNPNSGKSLGITGIWLSPIMKSPTYHKYDVTNYKSIDPNFGTIEDFQKLIQECNKRGIKVIIDLVLNHTSVYNAWWKEAKKAVLENDLENPMIDYYSIVTEENKLSGHAYCKLNDTYSYECNFSDTMPELNWDNESLRNELRDILQFWFDLGVGGFRLDAAKYIYLDDVNKNNEYWKWFMETALDINPNAYVVGEVWTGDSALIPYYESINCFDFGMSQSEGAIAQTAKLYDSVTNYVKYLVNYRKSVENVNANAILNPFISNHDQNRSAGYLSVPDYEAQMAANLYLLSYGNPFIYYGEEIGMKGIRGNESTDANRRLKMLWGDKDTVENPAGSTMTDDKQINGTVKSQLNDKNSLYNHYKKVIMLRNANPEIARGSYTFLDFSDEYTFGGFLSTYQNSIVGVFHNTGDETLTIDLSNQCNHSFSTLRGYAGMSNASLKGQILTIGPKTSVILK